MGTRLFYLTLLLLLYLTSWSSSMEKIDSLLAILPQEQGIQKAKTLLNLSESFRNNTFIESIKYGEQAAELAQKEGDHTLAALVFKSLGTTCYFSGEFDLALSYYTKSYSLYKNSEDIQGQGNCLNNIGLIFEETSSFDSASYYYKASYELEKQLGNQSGMGRSLVQLGNLFYYRDKLQQALDNYYQAMLIFEQEKDSSNLGGAYNSLGIIYREWNQFDKALEYYKTAIAILEKTKDERLLSFALTNIAEIYNIELHDYQKALHYYEQSLQLKHKANDRIGIALLNNNIGTLYASMEDVKNAMYYFEKSKSIYEEFSGETGLAMVLYNMGALHLEMGHFQKAIPYLQQSLTMAEEDCYSEFVGLSQEALMHCYAGLGEYSNYKNMYRLYALNKDTLIDKLYQLQSQETEIKYQIAASMERSKLLMESNARQEIMVKKYKLILAGIAAIVVLIVFVYALFVKPKKQR